MKKLLLAAFEPFGGENINASLEAQKMIPDRLGDWEIVKIRVPVIFGKDAETVLETAEEIQPKAILCLGQAETRELVSPEFVGINFMHGRIADNAGLKPVRQEIVPGGPAAYFTTMPAFEMTEAIKAAGVGTKVSYSAGTYVCNDLLYRLLHHYSLTGEEVTVGFIHVPVTPEQAGEGKPSMETAEAAKAIISAIEALV